MTPELQHELAAWLAEMRDAMQHGTQFALDQAPLVVREQLLYARVLYASGAVLAVVALVVGCYLLARRSRRPDMAMPVGAMLCVVAFVMGGTCGIQLLEVVLAPRVYIIEWLAQLVRS